MIPTEDSIKQYKIDLANKIEDILSSLDEHEFNDDRVYPIIVTTLLDNNEYGSVFCSGSSTDDVWLTFLDNVDSDDPENLDIGLDNYHELLKFHNKHDKPITICASEYKVSIPFGSISSENGVISSITEKPTIKHHVNAGIYVIDPDVIKKMKKNEPINMIHLVENYIKTSDVIAYPLYESWIDIGSPEDYLKAQNKLKIIK